MMIFGHPMSKLTNMHTQSEYLKSRFYKQMAQVANTGVQTISLHHRRPRCLVLWLLVLELQPALSHHATISLSLSVKSKALCYSRRLSEVAIARNRRSPTSLGALRRTILLKCYHSGKNLARLSRISRQGARTRMYQICWSLSEENHARRAQFTYVFITNEKYNFL